MRIDVEAVLEAAPQDFIGWGLGADGRLVLQVIAGPKRVAISGILPSDARELGCTGIYAALHLEQAAHAAQGNPGGVASALVDASGIPLRTVRA